MLNEYENLDAENQRLLDEYYFVKLVSELDILMTVIGKQYILSNKSDKVEEFRKNYIVELLSTILMPRIP